MHEHNMRWVEDIIHEQNQWRMETINLIASENVLSNRIRRIMGSDFCHRYAEGHPGERYYQGTEKIDIVESRLRQQIKAMFGARNADVRPISGTIANEAVFSRYIKPGDVVMVNSTPGGGHISHHASGSVGKYTQNIMEFPITPDGYHIDVDKAIERINILKPKLLILGKSLFLFPEPVQQLAEVCKKKKIHVVYDGAHVLGLIAGKQFQDPLSEGAELVTGSTHKTFYGSQRGIVLSSQTNAEWRKIDKGAFPGSSSNHHLDTLAALAMATYEMMQFGAEYAAQVVKNAKAFAENLASKGFDVQAKDFGFTESHQVAVNVEKYGGGEEVARVLMDNNIVVNMNLLPFEPLKNLQNPSGIRIGVQEMTRFGMKESQMETIADLIKQVLMEGKYLRKEVKAFRSGFTHVHYSFDKKDEAALV